MITTIGGPGYGYDAMSGRGPPPIVEGPLACMYNKFILSSSVSSNMSISDGTLQMNEKPPQPPQFHGGLYS